MGSNRLPYFPFHADDYLNDGAVMAMDADTEGCYIRLLARSWCNSTPGRIPKTLVAEMAGLHRITDPIRREVVLEQLKAAFDVSGAAFWIQKRMLAEFTKLSATLESRRKGAEMTNAQRALSVTVSGRSPTEEVEVEVEVDTEESKSKSLARSSISPSVLSPKKKSKSEPKSTDPDDQSWMQLFDWFWVEYPRKIGKPGALRAWKAIRPQNQITVDAIGAGLEVWRPQWSDPQYIPHPSTWLNQRRWEDQP